MKRTQHSAFSTHDSLLEKVAAYLSEHSPLFNHPELLGVYQSLFPGRGLDFLELREYTPESDARSIDWKASLRSNHIYKKVFTEEQEVPLLLAFDISASLWEIPHSRALVFEMAAILHFCANHHHDPVGISLFSDQSEWFIPPCHPFRQTNSLPNELLNFVPKSPQTNLAAHAHFLQQRLPPYCRIFLMSDFINQNWQSAWAQLAVNHEITLACFPPIFPKLKKSKFQLWSADPETNQPTQPANAEQLKRHITQLQNYCQTYHMPFVQVTDDPIVALLQLFQKGY